MLPMTLPLYNFMAATNDIYVSNWDLHFFCLWCEPIYLIPILKHLIGEASQNLRQIVL
jgi:hypothetical protein